jgi:acyl-CoA hydrolase
VNPLGNLDLGELLATIDWECGTFAMELCNPGYDLADGSPPVGAVTVAMQSTPFRDRMTFDRTYTLNMHPSGRTKSTLEITADVLGERGTDIDHLTSFYLTFVTIDKTGNAIEGAPLIHPSSPGEEDIMREAAERRGRNLEYRMLAREGTLKEPVSDGEREIIEGLREGLARAPELYVPTRLATARPLRRKVGTTHKNIHGIVFGGYLAHNMFNHAWHHARHTIAQMQGGDARLPLVVAMNQVTFDAAVHVGDRISYRVQTVYSSEHALVERVTVYAKSAQNGGKPIVTNTALFTFVAANETGTEQIPLAKTIVPAREGDLAYWTAAYRGQREHKARAEALPYTPHHTTTNYRLLNVPRPILPAP